MDINLSLSRLFADVFGYNSDAFDPKPEDVKGNVQGSRKEENAAGTPWYASGRKGVELFMPIVMEYTEQGTAGRTVQVNLPHAVISVSGRKTIIETPLTERRGTVKEIINLMDYDIVVKGMAISDSNEYPEGIVQELRTLYEQQTAVVMRSGKSDIFLLDTDRQGSDKVVIKEITFPEYQGVKHVQPYQMVLVSDTPFNLVDLS